MTPKIDPERPKSVSQGVFKEVSKIAKKEGAANKIDTWQEYEHLSEYLSKGITEGKLNEADQDFIRTQLQEFREAEQKKQEKLKKKNLKKEKKEKKPGLFKKLKEAWSELKKVTWPTFGTVVKKTLVVILVTVIFTVVLFGMDYLLGLLYNLFMS